MRLASRSSPSPSPRTFASLTGYGGQPSPTGRANRSRERRERLAKVGGKAGIRTLRSGASKWLMARGFWLQSSRGQSVGRSLPFAAVTSSSLESTGVVETFWQRWRDGRNH